MNSVFYKRLLPLAGAACLSFTLSLSVSAESASSEKFSSGDYTYTIDEETGNGCIIDYNGSETNLVLPETLDDITITSIASNAFYNCDTIQTFTLSNALTEIGGSVFYDCSSITAFQVPDGNSTFYAEDGVLFRSADDCLVAYPSAASASAYDVKDGVTEIYSGAFSKAFNLKEITLPEGLLYIDDWAFAYDTISDIKLPSSLVEICDYAFAYCTNITDWEIPADVTYIGNAAFAMCQGMTEIQIPNKVTEIGQAAFAGTGLTEITIPPAVATDRKSVV